MSQILADHIADFDHVIWDFNGTLVDDAHIFAELISELLKQHNLPTLDRDSYRDVFCFPIIEYYKKLGFNLQKHEFKKLADWFIENSAKRLLTAQLFHGIEDVLKSNIESGRHQSILSAAHQDHLERAVDHLGIRSLFHNIFGLPDHYAFSKMERGLELIERSHIAKDRTILVGDTDHDLEVGKAMGIEVLLVADGHQSFDRLQPLHSRVIASRYR